MHSLKGFGPSGFDLVKKYSKLSVSQQIRQKKWKTQFLLRFSAEHSYILSLLMDCLSCIFCQFFHTKSLKITKTCWEIASKFNNWFRLTLPNPA